MTSKEESLASPCSDLINFADGELDQDREASFRAHLDSCEECKKELEEALLVSARLSTLMTDQLRTIVSVMRIPDGSQPGDNYLMMVSPQFWRHWPVLALQKMNLDGSLPDTGILYDRADKKDWTPSDGIAVRFRFLDNCILGLTTKEQLNQSPIANIDELLADGWIVD